MERPIAVIDSGVGGLTVLHELMRQLPKEKFVYLGDTYRCPYGSKTKEQVREFVWDIVNYLLKRNIKCLIIACNTATAYTIKELQSELTIPVIGVIKPGGRAAVNVTRNKKIGVIGTEGTIQSRAYSKVLHHIDPTLNIYSLACPPFVPLIEKGIIQEQEAKQIITETLIPLKDTDIDTLILGCTHYPIIKDLIQKVLGPDVKIVSSGEETARETSSILDSFGLTTVNSDMLSLNHEFYTTGELEKFKEITRLIFNENLNNLNEVKFNNAVFS